MSKYVILYRINDDECRYINIDNDVIHLDYQGRPTVSNARCLMRINEEFDEVETWLTEDVFNRMKNTDGTDTFSDVLDMIKHGEHEDFEVYIKNDELEKICDEYNVDIEDAENIVWNYYDNDYFDSSIIAVVWDNYYDIAESYVDECCNIESWMYPYIDFESMGEDIASDKGMYELYDGRIVEYSN